MSIYPIILSQEKLISKDDLHFPFEERGLQFGDGIYEVIRIYNGSYYLFEEHLDRLYRSTEAIQIQLTIPKNELKKLLLELLKNNKINTDGKLYLQVTRGSATRDHIFPKDTAPNIFAYIENLPRNLNLLEKGADVITKRDTRWENCYIKSLNLLPNVLAKQAAFEQDCYEAILHKDGCVTECSSSNIYLVKDKKIYTHPATNQILHGCVRMRVEEFANLLEVSFIEEPFYLKDINLADELFLSSSTSEIMPVVSVDKYKIGNGTPGEITKRLQQAYEKDANIS